MWAALLLRRSPAHGSEGPVPEQEQDQSEWENQSMPKLVHGWQCLYDKPVMIGVGSWMDWQGSAGGLGGAAGLRLCSLALWMMDSCEV